MIFLTYGLMNFYTGFAALGGWMKSLTSYCNLFTIGLVIVGTLAHLLLAQFGWFFTKTWGLHIYQYLIAFGFSGFSLVVTLISSILIDRVVKD